MYIDFFLDLLLRILEFPSIKNIHLNFQLFSISFMLPLSSAPPEFVQ